MNNEKESIDLMADDVVPVKKNKKGKGAGRKSNRYNEDDDEDNKDEEGDVTGDMEFDNKKSGAKNKGKTPNNPAKKVDLNKSNTSYRSGWQDRSSVTTSLSRKAQTLEQYLQPIFGEQFYNLVMLLQAEQQVEVDQDMGKKISSGDRKMLAKRDKRFGENRSQLLDPEGFEMTTPQENEKSKKSGHVNEILKYLKHAVNAGDLVGLVNGETSEESLINVYMKILEKINLVLLKANDFLRN